MADENGDGDDDALLRALAPTDGAAALWDASIDAEDGDDSDGDFELEMIDDDEEEDDEEEDDDEEDDDEDEEEEEDDRHRDDHERLELSSDPVEVDGGDANDLGAELLALATAAADDDTIAHRTRTKLSLVDVEIDSLESLLPPDPSETALEGGENEYQRFLASLLPAGDEEDSLSFLDEEDEEYRPDEDDDDEEEDGEEGSGRRKRGYSERRDSVEDEDHDDNDDDDDDEDGDDPQVVRISKRELTELLWDSTQVKVPPRFPKPAAPHANGAAASIPNVASMVPVAMNVDQRTAESGRPKATGGTSVAETTVEDLKDAAAMKDMNGSVSPQQCIQLASQMHKHFQLLLQTFHMIASNEAKPVTDPDQKALLPPGQRKVKPPVNKEQLDECAEMLRELQIRGKRALQYKAQVLSKLTTSGSSGGSSSASREQLGERRVTRSISAAHAAVAHPSMFDIVGSQSMEELTEAFEQGCSVAERNQKLHKSMLELDKHVLLNRKKRRPSPNPRKLMFLSPEDRLLLYGVKRYGVEPESWTEIRETLLPTKEVADLSKRYRYLASKKKRAGGNEFKEFNNEVNARKKGMWMIEEDVRIARGVVEYFGDNRRFSRIASKYLPHRHRLEIRKRWERLKDRYRAEDGSVKEVNDSLATRAAAREFAAAVKQYLENKLRKKVVNIPATALAPAGKTGADRGTNGGDISKPTAKGSRKRQPPQHAPVADETTNCSVKNLHPALFFSSWAVIHPATLLERTCEHNWPAFIGEKRKDISSASTLDLVSRAAASRVEEEAAFHRVNDAPGDERLEPISECHDEEDDGGPSSAMDFTLDAVESDGDDLDTAEEEESDFEREELLSSDADESDSEYEQMELSDNEDDEDGDGLDDGDSVDEGDVSHEEDEAQSGEAESQATPVKHTLRLENLRQPGDERARQALEALERRITGNKPSVAGSVTGFTPLLLETSAFEPLAVDDVQFDDADLLAYEELRDSSSSGADDGFEQDELHSSSDEEFEREDGYDVSNAAKRNRETSGLQPLKRPKLQLSTRCGDCGSAPCVCSSARMQRLMDRIEPRHGASDRAPGNV